jgi:hypothetical protein
MHLRSTTAMLALAAGAVTALALPSAASADAASAERLRVAVVPGVAVNLDAARVDTLSQDLADALRTELEIDAIGGLEVRRQLPAAGLPPDCVAIPSCVADVARLLGAQQLLFVVMIDTGTGGAIQIDSTWVEPATRRAASRPAIDIAAIADARSRFAAAAQQLLPDAPVRQKPTPSLGRMSPEVPRHFTTSTYLTTGATIAGLGVAISFGISARGKYKDCEALAGDGVDCDPDRESSLRTAGLVADLGWVVAIGGAVATAVLYATSGESSRVIVEPVPGGAAITAIGRF